MLSDAVNHLAVDRANRYLERPWLPRDLDPLSVNDSDLKGICDQLNTTPRKCLGFKTPSEVFRQKMMTAPCVVVDACCGVARQTE